jgi:hypothetical protein
MRLRAWKRLAHLGVDDEIDVALPIADGDVRQAVPLLGQGPQRLGQDAQRPRLDRQLALARAHHHAAHADDVADVEQLETCEITLRELILKKVGLDLPGAVEQNEENHLTHPANRHDAAAERHRNRRRFEDLGRLLRVRRQNGLGRIRDGEVVGVGVVSKGAQRLGFCLALADDRVFHRWASGERAAHRSRMSRRDQAPRAPRRRARPAPREAPRSAGESTGVHRLSTAPPLPGDTADGAGEEGEFSCGRFAYTRLCRLISMTCTAPSGRACVGAIVQRPGLAGRSRGAARRPVDNPVDNPFPCRNSGEDVRNQSTSCTSRACGASPACIRRNAWTAAVRSPSRNPRVSLVCQPVRRSLTIW